MTGAVNVLLNAVSGLFLLAGLAVNPLALSMAQKAPLSGWTSAEIVFSIFLSASAIIYALIFWKLKHQVVNYLLLLGVVCGTLFILEWAVARRPESKLFEQFSFTEGEKRIVCFPHMANSRMITAKHPRTGQDMSCAVELPALRQAGYFRDRSRQALLIGDSFTYGGGVFEEDTLGFLLGVAFPQYNFLNYGKSGTSAEGILGILRSALDEHPGVQNVIYFYNINDIPFSGDVAARLDYVEDLEMIRLSRVDKKLSPFGQWLSKSKLFQIFLRASIVGKESQLTKQVYIDAYDPKMDPNGVKGVEGILSGMAALTRARNVNLTVVFYPLLYTERNGNYPFANAHRLIEGICRTNGILFIDGIMAFSGVKDFREFMVHPILDHHPNGAANRKMVDLLFKAHQLRPILKE